jgi:hypothetical protein
MSGYLGRMWASMVKGAVPLRPVSGSIYADRGASRQTTFHERGFEQNDIERAGPASPASEPGVTTRRPATERRESHAPEFTSLEYEPLLPPRSARSFEISGAVRRPAVSDGPDILGERDRERNTPSHRLAPRNLAELRSQSTTESAPVNGRSAADPPHMQTGDARVEWEFNRGAQIREGHEAQPQAVDESVRRSEVLPPAPRQQFPQLVQQKNPVSAHRGEIGAKPAPEPDVEVHIGRIEVVAVQPPAPRAPAPRQSRTTSLDDYLSSRSGRNR